MTYPTPTTRRRLRLLAVALLLVTPLLGLSVQAQPPGGGPGMGPHGMIGAAGGPDGPGRMLLPRIAKFLDLTDAQIEQAKALFEGLKANGEPLREEGEALRTELQGLLQGDAPDPATVGTLVIRLHELGEEGRALREGVESGFAAILTPEQLERWELAKDLRGFLGHGPGRGGRR